MGKDFKFEISLSVLNHLGRNLYRNFITVLGEAISNAWDADANNVWIKIDKEANSFSIEDDGEGMNDDEFQNKFLKIGYSKREKGISKTKSGRPFIGRKGIGKLALLSCADKITIVTRKETKDNFTTGTIDNAELDEKILEQITADEYKLEHYDDNRISEILKESIISDSKGTYIYFENMHNNISSNIDQIKKLIALFFRFSIIDQNFSIFLNGEKITEESLKCLTHKSQFLWSFNEKNSTDTFYKSIKTHINDNTKIVKNIYEFKEISGFIASVEKPKDLNIIGTGEKVGIDLFVNGRLREQNVVSKHLPNARIVSEYLFGQIHVNSLDGDEKDRFTSSREGVLEDDEQFKKFTKDLEEILRVIYEDWDNWRRKLKLTANPEVATQLQRKIEAAQQLVKVSGEEYITGGQQAAVNSSDEKVNKWLKELEKDAEFNTQAYIDCYHSENLLRKYVSENSINVTSKYNKIAKKYKDQKKTNAKDADIVFQIRQSCEDIQYLEMHSLCELVDQNDINLLSYANRYKPVRDAAMHTARLSEDSKRHLSEVWQSIKTRIINILHKNGSV